MGRSSVWRFVPWLSLFVLVAYVAATFYFLSQVSTKVYQNLAEPQGLLRLENTPAASWTVEDVGMWLMVQGFPQYRQRFGEAFVNGKRLLEADKQELENRLKITSFLDVHRILKLVDKLKQGKFEATGLGVHEVGVYATGDSLSKPPRSTIMSHNTVNLDEVLKLTSELMGRRIVRVLTPDGLDLAHADPMPNQIIVLEEGQFFVFPIEKIGYTRQVYFPLDNRSLTVETLSDSPRVFRIRHFIKDDECDAIISWSKDRMGPSTVAEQGVAHNNKVDNQIRTSSTTWVPPNWPVAPGIRERVATLTRLPMENAEDMQVLRYEQFQHYWSHHDYFDPKLYPDPLYKTTNRFVTVLFYLSDGFQGGETVFPYANGFGDPHAGLTNYAACDTGIKVPPEKGTAVMFYSLTAPGHQNAELDPSSLHGSCDVTSNTGTKWAANYWIRNKRWWHG